MKYLRSINALPIFALKDLTSVFYVVVFKYKCSSTFHGNFYIVTSSNTSASCYIRLAKERILKEALFTAEVCSKVNQVVVRG